MEWQVCYWCQGCGFLFSTQIERWFGAKVLEINTKQVIQMAIKS